MENLSGGELRFLDFIKGKTEQESFSPRWECLYDVSPALTLQKLISQGYLNIEQDYAYNMTKSTVADLKYVLREYGLKVSGKKSELIERLKENIDKSVLESEFDCKRYCLTQKGTDILEKYSAYILNVKNSMGFSFEEVEEALTELPANISCNPHDVLWGLLNKRKLAYCMNKEWGLYRNDLLRMGDLLYSENRVKESLPYYLSVFYIDMSGMENGNMVGDFDSLIPFCMADKLQTIITQIDESPEEICEMLNAYVDQNCYMLPFRYFSDDIVKRILYRIFKEEVINISRYKRYANKPDNNSLDYNTYSFLDDYDECDDIYTRPNRPDNVSSSISNIPWRTFIMALLVIVISVSLIILLVWQSVNN